MDEGATIVTHQMNRPYYEKVWSAPRTLNPDKLSQSKKMAMFETFTDTHVLTDGARTIEMHRIASSPHHDGFAMVYLPAEKILIEADAYTPAPANAAAAAPMPAAPGAQAQAPATSPTTLNLYVNVQRLKLEVDQIAAPHGPRLATMRDLAEASGRAGTN